MDVQEMGWGGIDCIIQAQDRDKVADVYKGDNEPWSAIECGEFVE